MLEKPRSKTSRLAIVSLVLGILSLFVFVLAGIPAIVLGFMSLLKIGRSHGALKGNYIAWAGMNVAVVCMCIFYWLWSRDAPPIPNDYTIADLRSAPAEYAESFELLKTLIDEEHNIAGSPAIGLSDGDMDMIAEIRGILMEGTEKEIAQILSRDFKDIKLAWAVSEKARDVIRRLNEFPEIADLTEPGEGFKMINWRNLIELTNLYQVYAHLQTTQDDIHAFTVELIELDSVFRKFSLNARLFIERLICHLCLATDINIANAIVNHPCTSRSTVELLAKQFTPLTEDQLSLRNGVLSEYLFTKNAVCDTLGSSHKGMTPLLKVNSTLRIYKNCCDGWLEAAKQGVGIVKTRLSAWPDHYPFEEPDPLSTRGSLPLIYWCYNPFGSRCIRMLGFFYSADPERSSDLPVRADLLEIVLNKRLGKDVSLDARAYSDEYIVDVENKKIFSPGPDGKVGTKDDIKLRISPEVLGW
ncbi:MAG: DUF4190 domain-containing protein [Sedimentisphaerales bacterium]|nr:DUF4190 domain-containing protein [Sedimentisphaerales bacterium]